MSETVENLHRQMSQMSLGDLCLLCGQAINMGMDKRRVKLMLNYLEIAMIKYRLDQPTPTPESGKEET